MSLVDSIKDVLFPGPDSESGVVYECAECGERFEEAAAACPNCGADEIRERKGFDLSKGQ